MRLGLLLAVLFSVPKSIYVNFKLLSIKQAVKFPMLVHYNTELDSLSGHIIIAGSPRPLSIKYGFTGSFGTGGKLFKYFWRFVFCREGLICAWF